MIGELRESCRRLLEDGTVQVVIGWGASGHPVLVTAPEDVERLDWNDRCFANLTVYLKRKEIRDLGRPAIFLKPCDERALAVLEQESQVERGAIQEIPVACEGLGIAKCAKCDKAANGAGAAAEAPDALLAKSPAERMAFWKAEFARCTKCYACRQVCPLCYCRRCVADKSRPTVIDTSATLKGNFAWHITRAFHLAARCVGCGECARVCPAGIDLALLNRSLARAAEREFGYRAGMDRDAPPLIGMFNAGDKEDFIR